jgi:preprotein translocase subunit SecG
MELLAALPAGHYILATLFVIVCLLTMLVVLIQKGRGGGLSGAFGGVGGHSAFGAKTGDVFTWITVGLAAAFILLSVWLNFTFRALPSGSLIPPSPTAATTTQPAGPEGPAPSGS